MDPADLRRIAFVGRRFTDLQGLYRVLVGGAFILVFGTYVVAPPAEGGAGIWLAMAAVFACIAPCRPLVRHYYESRFGRVTQERHDPHSWYGALIGGGSVIVGNVMRLPPLAAIVAVLACFNLWTAIRDWPYRTYHAPGFLALALVLPTLTTPAAAAAPDLSVALRSSFWESCRCRSASSITGSSFR
jgi:hypothetical protein